MPLGLEDDTLFRDNDDVFEGYDPDPNSTPGPDGALIDDDVYPPAFDEDSRIRNAYIKAYILSTRHGATHSAIHEHLSSVKDTLMLTEEETNVEIVGLESTAPTLYTAERRLRIDPRSIHLVLCAVQCLLEAVLSCSVFRARDFAVCTR